eukprot:6075581-Prymnesium_polylepis.1
MAGGRASRATPPTDSGFSWGAHARDLSPRHGAHTKPKIRGAAVVLIWSAGGQRRPTDRRRSTRAWLLSVRVWSRARARSLLYAAARRARLLLGDDLRRRRAPDS